MRGSLFVSAVFAVSLFAGAAMADRPGEDGGRTTRMPSIAELKASRLREVREARTQERQQQTKVTRDRVADRLRARGDMVDRTPKGTSSKGSHSVKSGPDIEKMMRRINEKQEAQRNCAPTDDSCASFGKVTGPAKAEKAKAEAQAADMQKQELKKMIDQKRAEKMRKLILQKICEKNANACDENL